MNRLIGIAVVVSACSVILADETNPSRTGDRDGVVRLAVDVSHRLDSTSLCLREVLAHYIGRGAIVVSRSPWELMHAVVGFGVDTEFLVGTERYNGIGYLCHNGRCQRQFLFTTVDGRLTPQVGPGLQGHNGQFLAILAQSYVEPTYRIKVDDRDFTVRDLIEYEKRTCRDGTELSFKLIGLMHYLRSDATWTSDDGEQWSIPRLIAGEIDQPVVGGTCGGTHRLMGLSYAVRKRRERGEMFTGEWARAKTYVEDFQEHTFKLQNEDGSFSTAFFARPENRADINRKLTTTGHILEWLVYSLPKDELTEPRIVKAVEYLATLLLEHPDRDWPIGPKGHALHALALYDERVFGSIPGKRDHILKTPVDAATAERPARTSRR